MFLYVIVLLIVFSYLFVPYYIVWFRKKEIKENTDKTQRANKERDKDNDSKIAGKQDRETERKQKAKKAKKQMKRNKKNTMNRNVN